MGEGWFVGGGRLVFHNQIFFYFFTRDGHKMPGNSHFVVGDFLESQKRSAKTKKYFTKQSQKTFNIFLKRFNNKSLKDHLKDQHPKKEPIGKTDLIYLSIRQDSIE